MINMSSEKKLLIAYSSIAGCTEEVAKKIAELIDIPALNVDLLKVNDKKEFKKFDMDKLANYDFILLGSSIMVGKLNKNVHQVLEKISETGKQDLKLGLYICCMKAYNEEKIEESVQEYINPSLAEYNLEFDLVDAFGGKLDFSPESKMNVITKKLLKKIMVRDNPDIDEVEPKVYDFRDWTQIERFAAAWKEKIMS